MSEQFFTIINILNNFLWDYIGILLIIFIGSYFTIKNKFYQLSILIRPRKYIGELLSCAQKDKQGIHPIKLYFASVGGMVGLGNLVTVTAVVTLGGPGGVVWMWLASFVGMIVKYSEIYLGIKYRVKTAKGYDGGPMYFLKEAFKGSKLKLDKILPMVVCLLLCVYGAEISIFLTVTDTFVDTFEIDRIIVIGILLILVIMSAVGGVQRLSLICSVLMPSFMISYVILGLWIILTNTNLIPGIFNEIFSDAFTLKSSATGVIGGNVLLAMHYGIQRAVYSGDIGIGYDSIVQSETQTTHPERQARLAIFALFSDTLICTITIMIIFVTGVVEMEGIKPSEYIIHALSQYVPYPEIYIAFLFFIAGFTTIIGYLVVGQKAAIFLHKKIGKPFYILYSIVAFIIFSFHNQADVMLIMSISGGLLMVINLTGVFLLRKEIKFCK